MPSLLLFGALALIAVSLALAPLESLAWWAGWFGDDHKLEGAAGAVRGELFRTPGPLPGGNRGVG